MAGVSLGGSKLSYGAHTSHELPAWLVGGSKVKALLMADGTHTSHKLPAWLVGGSKLSCGTCTNHELHIVM